MGKLIFWVLFVNVITNPASQIAAIFFGRVMASEISALVMICLVELVAVTVEFGIMPWLFSWMYYRGTIDRPVTTKRTIQAVLVANLASFIFGFAGLILVLIEVAP